MLLLWKQNSLAYQLIETVQNWDLLYDSAVDCFTEAASSDRHCCQACLLLAEKCCPAGQAPMPKCPGAAPAWHSASKAPCSASGSHSQAPARTHERWHDTASHCVHQWHRQLQAHLVLRGHPDVVAVGLWRGMIAVQHALRAFGSSGLPQQQCGPHRTACTSTCCPGVPVKPQPAAEQWQLTARRAAVRAYK